MISAIVNFIVFAIIANRRNRSWFSWGVAGALLGWAIAFITILLFSRTIRNSSNSISIIVGLTIIDIIIVGFIGLKVIKSISTEQIKDQEISGLNEIYSNMEYEELVERSSSGTLTKIAQKIANEEMSSRKEKGL